MKTVSTLLFVALSLGAFGQQLPAVPAKVDPVNLRLEMAGAQFVKSANATEAAVYCALFGSAMTALAYKDKPSAGNIMCLLTVSAVYGFSLKSAGHKREAGRLLHGQ